MVERPQEYEGVMDHYLLTGGLDRLEMRSPIFPKLAETVANQRRVLHMSSLGRVGAQIIL